MDEGLARRHGVQVEKTRELERIFNLRLVKREDVLGGGAGTRDRHGKGGQEHHVGVVHKVLLGNALLATAHNREETVPRGGVEEVVVALEEYQLQLGVVLLEDLEGGRGAREHHKRMDILYTFEGFLP